MDHLKTCFNVRTMQKHKFSRVSLNCFPEDLRSFLGKPSPKLTTTYEKRLIQIKKANGQITVKIALLIFNSQLGTMYTGD